MIIVVSFYLSVLYDYVANLDSYASNLLLKNVYIIFWFGVLFESVKALLELIDLLDKYKIIVTTMVNWKCCDINN